MTTKTITLQLSDELATQAEAVGLLSSDQLVKLIQKELSRLEQAASYANVLDALAQLDPAMPQDEIDAELREWKRERSAKRD